MSGRRGACFAAATAVLGCLAWSAQAGADIGRANLDGSGVNRSFIATTPGSWAGVAVDDAHLYWSNDYASGGHSIGRANLDGTGIDQNFIPLASIGYKTGVAVNGAHVYWGDTEGDSYFGAIGRANLDGSMVEPEFITVHLQPIEPAGVAVGGGHIYWGDTYVPGVRGYPGGFVWWANLDGSNAKHLNSVFPSGVAVRGGHVYWSRWGAIGRANLDGSETEHNLITTPGDLTGVAVGGGHIYWGHRLAGTIGRANLDGSEVDPNFIANAGCVTGVAVDDGHLYWSNDGDCSDHTVTAEIKRKRLLMADGHAFAYVSVPASEASPNTWGTVRIRTVKRIRYRGERRRLTLAAARRDPGMDGGPLYFYPGTTPVSLRFSDSMARLVRRNRKTRRVRVIVRITDYAGNQATVAKRMRLRVYRSHP